MPHAPEISIFLLSSTRLYALYDRPIDHSNKFSQNTITRTLKSLFPFFFPLSLSRRVAIITKKIDRSFEFDSRNRAIIYFHRVIFISRCQLLKLKSSTFSPSTKIDAWRLERIYMCVCVHRIVRYYRSTHIYLMQIERANYVFDIEKKKEIIYNSVENVENNRWKNIFTRYVNFSYPCTLLNTYNYSFPFFNYIYIYIPFFYLFNIYIPKMAFTHINVSRE